MAEFQYLPIVVDNKVVAEINKYKLDFKNGAEPAFGAGVIIGGTTGILVIGIDATTATPVNNQSVDLVDMLVVGKKVPIGVPHNGKTYVAFYRVAEASIDADAEKGKVTGQFKFTPCSQVIAIV